VKAGSSPVRCIFDAAMLVVQVFRALSQMLASQLTGEWFLDSTIKLD